MQFRCILQKYRGDRLVLSAYVVVVFRLPGFVNLFRSPSTIANLVHFHSPIQKIVFFLVNLRSFLVQMLTTKCIYYRILSLRYPLTTHTFSIQLVPYTGEYSLEEKMAAYMKSFIKYSLFLLSDFFMCRTS